MLYFDTGARQIGPTPLILPQHCQTAAVTSTWAASKARDAKLQSTMYFADDPQPNHVLC